MKPSFLLLMLCVLSILVAGISHDFGMGGVSVAFGVIAGVFGFASFCVYLNEIGKGRK